jgi:TonB family protein
VSRSGMAALGLAAAVTVAGMASGSPAREPAPFQDVRARLLKSNTATVSAACGAVMAPWAYRGRYGERTMLRPYTKVSEKRAWVIDFVDALMRPSDWDSTNKFRGRSKPCDESHDVPLITVTFENRGEEAYALLSLEGRSAVVFEANRPLGAVWFRDRVDTVFALIRRALIADTLGNMAGPPLADPGIMESIHVDSTRIDSLPEVLEKVPPTYPPAAVAWGVQGTVSVRALVGTGGLVEDAFVERSIPRLNDAALDAVWRWKFKPAIAAGNPVAVWVLVPVKFSLR